MPRNTFLVLCSKCSTCKRQSRQMATSAQKRKWQRQKGDKPFLKKKYAEVAAEEAVVTKPRAKKNSWQPLFFLGVFPVFLSVAVVLTRDDLREEVNTKGIGRFLEDYKKWRIKSRAVSASVQQQEQLQQQLGEVVEEESEFDKMLKSMEQRKPQ